MKTYQTAVCVDCLDKGLNELQKLRNLLDSSLDIICSFNHLGHFSYASSAATRIWGYTPEELIGRSPMELVFPADQDKTKAAAQLVMSGHDLTNFENRYIRKDGTVVPMLWSATFDNENNTMYCVAKDASEIKTLEKDLFKTRQLFQTFMDNSPLVGWITDEQGMMLYMNAHYLKTYGFTKADFGKNIYELFPKQLAMDYHLNNLKVLKKGKAIETVEQASLANGTLQTLKIFKFPLQVNGVAMVAGWAVDITEQTAIQEELTKSLERYYYVNEATSDAIYDWNIASKKLYCGSGFETIFGHAGKQMTLKQHLSRVHPEDLKKYKATVFAALRDEQSQKYVVEYRMKDSAGAYRFVTDKAFLIRSGDRTVRVIGAIQDSTKEKLLQKKLVEQEKRAKREVVKSIIETQEKERRKLSVELHDNVNQVLASCKLMLEYAKENKANAQVLTAKSYESLQTVIDEIRKISHDLNPSVIEDIGLAEAIEQMADKINLTNKLKVHFHNKVSAANTFREQDKVSIYRIIQEQLNNIIKHAQAKEVIITLVVEGNMVHLRIEDDGVGFDASKVKKGLGLKNINHRVEYHHGSLQITSAPGAGSCMDIALSICEN
jgi:PAS domain S-box-containing protein